MSANPTDFNDLAKVAGKAAVAAVIADALPANAADLLAEWPEPILPGGFKVPDIPGDLLPGWVGNMATAVSASTQTPPAAAVMMALSVLATCLQRQFVVQPYADDPSYTEPLAIWTLTGMRSGARKTQVIRMFAQVLMDWEKRQRDQLRREVARVTTVRAVSKKQIESLIRQASTADAEKRPELQREIDRIELDLPDEIFSPRLFTGDTTAETLQTLLVKHGERMAVLTDESGIFMVMAGMYNGGSASLDVFLQAHAGSAVRVDRAGREAYLVSPSLSFGLAIQPGILADVASNKRFADSGLLARFLYAIPESTVGKRDIRRRMTMPADVVSCYEAGIEGLLSGRRLLPDKPVPLSFDATALECWLEFCEEIERQLGDDEMTEAMTQWKSKLPGAVARIAGLFQLAEGMGTASAIGAEAVTRAIALGNLLIPHTEAALGLLGADQVESDAMALLKWAQSLRAASFTRRDCQKAMEGRFKSVN